MYRRALGLILAGMVLVLILAACGDATNTPTTGGGAAQATSGGNTGAMPGMTMKPGETMTGTTPAAVSTTTSAAATTPSGLAASGAATSTTSAPTTTMAGMTMANTSPAAVAATPGNDAMTNSLKGLNGKDFETMFIEEMIVHHQSAIDMAKLVPTNTKRPELLKLSQDIITAQGKEITDMTGWLASWYNAKPVTDSMSVPGMMEMMGDMDKLKNAKDEAFDKQFITMMVAHHQQAVSMASLLPGKTQRSELLKLGQDIIKSQSAEIEQMMSWQKLWFKL